MPGQTPPAVLYLTNNPNLGSTARILQYFLGYSRDRGATPCVAVQHEGDLARWIRERGHPVLACPMRLPSRLWPVPGWLDARRLASFGRRHGAAIVHCNEHNLFPVTRLLRDMLRVPRVCHVRFGVTRPWCEWAWGAGRMPDAVLWTTHFQKRHCAEAVRGLVPEDRQHVVRLGIDPEQFGRRSATRAATRAAWGAGEGDIVVGTASALRPIKRIHEFLDVAGPLAQADPRVRIVVAGGVMPGDEAYGERVRAQGEAAGLGERLRWLGHLSDVEPFMHAVDVFVSTSEFETFGNSVCEAMICGRPVAAYEGGSVSEVLGDAGLIVANGDVPGLRERVSRLIEDAGLRERLGELGRERVLREFSPAASFEQLQRVYAGLLG